MIRLHTVVALILAGGAVATSVPVQAQVSPEAKAILDRNSAFGRDIRTAYGDFFSTTTDAQGQKHPLRTQVWAETPDKMTTVHTSSKGSTAIYHNGIQSTFYVQRTNTYMTSQRVDPTVTSDLMGLLDGGLGPGGTLADTDGKRQISLVGKETVAGVACNHLRVVLPGRGSADLWLADGAEPLPVYMRAVMTAPQPQGVESYMRWFVNKPVPPETFRFVPPPGAKAKAVKNQPVGGR